MPPRTAYWPGSITVLARAYPDASSRSISPCMLKTLPGARRSLDAAMKVRDGTRWSTAWLVVSTISGLVSPGDRPFSAASVLMRRAMVSALGAIRS